MSSKKQKLMESEMVGAVPLVRRSRGVAKLLMVIF